MSAGTRARRFRRYQNFVLRRKEIQRKRMNSSEVIYSDFDNQFITGITQKSLNKKTNRDAVKQAVKNLILTDYYERGI